jgi:hypothetical protein
MMEKPQFKRILILGFYILFIASSLFSQDPRNPLPLFEEPAVEFWDSGNLGGPEDPVVQQVQSQFKPKIYSIGWSPQGYWCTLWVDRFTEEMGLTVLNTVNDNIEWQDLREVNEVLGATEGEISRDPILNLYRQTLTSITLTAEQILQIQDHYASIFETYSLDNRPGEIWSLPFGLGEDQYAVNVQENQGFFDLSLVKNNRSKLVSQLPRYEPGYTVENNLRVHTAVKSPFENRVVLLAELKDYESRHSVYWFVIAVGAHLEIGF